MRLRLALALTFSLTAGAALGQSTGKLTVVKQPPAAAKPAPKKPVPPPVPLMSLIAVRPDAGQCRKGCSQPYYFCNSDPQSGDCPGTWSQCVAACSAAPVRSEPAPTLGLR